MNPWRPALNSPVPAVVSIDAIDPSTPLKVAEIGSRTTAMPFTLSFGRSMADVSVTGSVTSKPSIHSADSCGRVPPMRSRPSRPRTTDGSSGSDCRMRGRGAGRRIASGADMVLPRCSIDEPEDVSADATTLVTSLACAIGEHDAIGSRRCAGRAPSRSLRAWPPRCRWPARVPARTCRLRRSRCSESPDRRDAPQSERRAGGGWSDRGRRGGPVARPPARGRTPARRQAW